MRALRMPAVRDLRGFPGARPRHAGRSAHCQHRLLEALSHESVDDLSWCRWPMLCRVPAPVCLHPGGRLLLLPGLDHLQGNWLETAPSVCTSRPRKDTDSASNHVP